MSQKDSQSDCNSACNCPAAELPRPQPLPYFDTLKGCGGPIEQRGKRGSLADRGVLQSGKTEGTKNLCVDNQYMCDG